MKPTNPVDLEVLPPSTAFGDVVKRLGDRTALLCKRGARFAVITTEAIAQASRHGETILDNVESLTFVDSATVKGTVVTIDLPPDLLLAIAAGAPICSCSRNSNHVGRCGQSCSTDDGGTYAKR